MTKPTAYSMPPWKAALRISAAFALCALLVFGLLWPVPFSFAAEKDAGGSEAVEEPAAPKTPVDDIDNVVVEAPSHAPAPSEPEAPIPASAPNAEPVAPRCSHRSRIRACMAYRCGRLPRRCWLSCGPTGRSWSTGRGKRSRSTTSRMSPGWRQAWPTTSSA